MADGGGIGISALVVVQAMSQAKSAWSEAEAEAEAEGEPEAASIWSAATEKILLGGAADVAHLRDVEAMLGTRKVRRSSATYSEKGDSSNVQTDREALMTVDELRRMPERIGLLAYKNRRGILLDPDGGPPASTPTRSAPAGNAPKPNSSPRSAASQEPSDEQRPPWCRREQVPLRLPEVRGLVRPPRRVVHRGSSTARPCPLCDHGAARDEVHAVAAPPRLRRCAATPPRLGCGGAP